MWLRNKANKIRPTELIKGLESATVISDASGCISARVIKSINVAENIDNDRLYLTLARHYERCLERYGDTHQGVDWPNADDARRRYQVMLDVIRREDKVVSLLDLGCGAAHLLDYLRQADIQNLTYTGLDISADFVRLCRQKYPTQTFIQADILTTPDALPESDYIVMNGLFTEKRELSYDQMFVWMTEMLHQAFSKARKGIAFNLMSKLVDWERDDLFHVPFDELATIINSQLSRFFVFRHDYGLYEYTAYVYREP